MTGTRCNIKPKESWIEAQHQIKFTFFAISAILILFAMFVQTIGVTGYGNSTSSPKWNPGTFEDNIYLTYDPLVPAPKQGVNITILSRFTPINSASINVQYTTPSGDTSSGAYIMNPAAANFTIFKGMIPPTLHLYPGISVMFSIKAWDYNSAMLVSKNHSYVVTNAGGWKHTTFDNNIALSYYPKKPKAFELVNISMKSKESDVVFKYVQVSVMYQQPGQKWLGPYSVPCYNISAIEVYAVIGSDPRNTPNQPGYNVTFWVTVYDMYWQKMESARITYNLNMTENPNPDKYSFFMIVVYDDNIGNLVSGAQIEIKNSTKTISGTTNEFGWYIPTELSTHNIRWLLIGDTYTVTVKYKSVIASVKYAFSPDPDANRTLLSLKDYKIRLYMDSMEFHFRIGVVLLFEAFPQLFIYPVYALAVIVPVLSMWFFYRKQEEERKRLTEQKKKLGHFLKQKKGIKHHMWELFNKETKKPHLIKPIGLFVLGIFGFTFVPFYPIWMALLLAAIVAIISYKFPYLSLIIVSVFATASCGYQSPEFGLVFLVFGLFILLIGFFEWKFSYLVFLTVFAGRFGIPYIVPIFTTMIFSTFLGIAVAATAFTFLTFLVTCGNCDSIGLLHWR